VPGEARRVTPDAEDIDLLLPEIGDLRIRLIDANTKASIQVSRPLTNALEWRRDNGSGSGRASIEIDLQGELKVELTAGDYEIRLDLTDMGYLKIPPLMVTVSSLPATGPYVVELVRGLEADVRVMGPPDSSHKYPSNHLVFLVERAQLDSIAGPLPPGDPRSNHSFGGDAGLHMRIDDPELMNQFLSKEEYFQAGAVLKALVPGHYFLKSYPDDLTIEPSEFEITGPERTEVHASWHLRGQ